jgi:shikimate dehydrogenase
MTDVYGIFGHPIGHSRSPAIHNRAFAALGIDAVYVPFAVAPAQLTAAVAGIRALGLCGLNITLPHKSAIMDLLDHVEPDARAIGAVNTVFRDGEKLCGTNTDAPGLARALIESDVSLRGARVTVLGAGGAARACVVGLARAGVTHLTLAARRVAEAEHVCAQLTQVAAPANLAVCAWEPNALRAAFATTNVLVQATSATLDGGPAADALAASLPLSALPDDAVIVDLVYRPLETSVLRRGRENGTRTVDGLGMLLHQAALAFELWTGRSAPLEVMRGALVG